MPPLKLQPGEIAKYTVIRVGDEICVDLMASASGIGYEEASKDQIIRMVDGVPIPFATPRLLYRMKEKNPPRERPRGPPVSPRELRRRDFRQG